MPMTSDGHGHACLATSSGSSEHPDEACTRSPRVPPLPSGAPDCTLHATIQRLPVHCSAWKEVD